MRRIQIYLVTLGLSGFWIGCGQSDKKSKTNHTEENVELTEKELIAKGEKIFKGKGTCISCHFADKKGIGPSVQDIVKIYEAEGASIVDFLKGKSDPVVDPPLFSVMEANLQLTKRMTQQELKALEAYMKSL